MKSRYNFANRGNFAFTSFSTVKNLKTKEGMQEKTIVLEMTFLNKIVCIKVKIK